MIVVDIEKSRVKPGEVYGKWTVLGYEFNAGRRNGNQDKGKAVCRCICGSITTIYIHYLFSGYGCNICRQLKVPDIKVGDKFGELITTSMPYREDKIKNARWKINVKCSCGWIGSVYTKALLTRQQKYHTGCPYFTSRENNGAWKGYGSISGSLWGNIVASAKHRARPLEVKIDIQYVNDLYLSQNSKCKLTHLPIDAKPIKQGLYNLSLDRINPELDYIPGNAQWLHKDVNLSKWDLQQQEYIDFCYLAATKKNKLLPPIEIQIYPRSKNFKGVGNISLANWNSIRDISEHGRYNTIYCRRRKHVKFDITLEQAWEMYLKQGGRCAETGIPIYFGNRYQNIEQTASLDRINSSKDYTIDNVRWVHKNINIMKMAFTMERFAEIYTAVADHNKPSPNVDDMLQPTIFTFINHRAVFKHMEPPTKGKFKGVHFNKEDNKFIASIGDKTIRYNLGYFTNEEEAAHNYDFYALKFWGDKCYLNFPHYDYSNFKPKKIL